MVLDVCRLCLATDMRTIDIAGTPLQHIYEKLTSILLHKMNWPVVACYLCHSQLMKTHDLMLKSLKADFLLTEIFLKASVIDRESITKIDRKAYKLNDVRCRSAIVPSIIMEPKLSEESEIEEGDPLTEESCSVNVDSRMQERETMKDLPVLKESEIKDKPVMEEMSWVHVNSRMLEVAHSARNIKNKTMKNFSVLEESEIKDELITEDGNSVHVHNIIREVAQDARKTINDTILDIKVEVCEVQNVKIETIVAEDSELRRPGGSEDAQSKESEESNTNDEMTMDIEEIELEPFHPSGDTDSEDLDDTTPPEILLEAQNARDTLLPPKSKEKYMAAYANFMQWKISKNVKTYSENVLLAYFNEISNKYKPSSLWCTYSMLKSTLRSKDDIDITSYIKLTSFLKKLSTGYNSRKSKVLSADNVKRFLKEAPNIHYLATKVALIFGITGACRRQELKNITINDIDDRGNMLLVKIKNSKNKTSRLFSIEGSFYEIVKKYIVLRPTNVKSDRFFVNYQKGKCTVQPIGVNKFGSMPKEIARYLELSDADSYTGHSFRRTAATMLTDSRSNMLIKHDSGWRCVSYV